MLKKMLNDLSSSSEEEYNFYSDTENKSETSILEVEEQTQESTSHLSSKAKLEHKTSLIQTKHTIKM